MATKSRNVSRVRRHARVREKIRGTAARPRLTIYRSLTQIYGQLIDDDGGRTLAAASSLDVRTRPAQGAGPLSASRSERAAASEPQSTAKKSELAKAVGTLLAERAKAAGVTEVVFDRGGYQYHGRVKALADAVRAAGVKV